jgi:hypothetical protein
LLVADVVRITADVVLIATPSPATNRAEVSTLLTQDTTNSPVEPKPD